MYPYSSKHRHDENRVELLLAMLLKPLLSRLDDKGDYPFDKLVLIHGYVTDVGDRGGNEYR